jgi:biopolymer transport protein ExbD
MPARLQKNAAVGSLSLTPLIDVVFLLLIFFLVATRFEQEERDMDVKLPQASEAEPTIASRQELFVSLTAEGRFFLGGNEVDLPSLEKTLETAYQRNPGRQRVVIRADRESRTQHLVAVLNACNKANIRNYSVAAE